MGAPLPTSSPQRDSRPPRRRREPPPSSAKMILRWVWLIGAAIALIALFVDMKTVTKRMQQKKQVAPARRKGDATDILAGLNNGPRYEDPSGLFSFIPPQHWVPFVPEGKFYNVGFRGPHQMDMQIHAVVTNGATFDGLVAALRKIERNLAADTHMDITYIGPHRAVKRSVQLFKSRVLLLDFLTGDIAHHIQFSTPPRLYEQYEPIFLRVMESYTPGRILPPIEPEVPASDP